MQTIESLPQSQVRRLGSLVVIGCLFAGLFTARAQAINPADEARQNANALFELGLFEQAIQSYAAFLNKWPADPKVIHVQYGKGASHFHLAQYKQAEALMRKVVGSSKCPDVPRAYFFWGQSLLMLRKPANAEGAFDTGIRALAKPKIPRNVTLLANLKEMRLEALYQQKKWKAVVAAAATLKGRAGNRSPRVAFQGAFARYQLKQYPEAGAAFIDLKPGVKGTKLQQQTHFLLGECLRKQGKIPQAIKEFGVAAGLEGADAPEALYRMSILHFSSGSFKSAAKHFDDYREMYKDQVRPDRFTDVRIFLGRSHAELKQFKFAEKVFADLALEPKASANVFLWQARMFQSQKNHARAVAVLQSALRKYLDDPLLPDLLYDYADNNFSLAKYVEAGKALDHLRRAAPKFKAMSALLHLNAICKHNTKDFAGSLKLCGEFLASQAQHPRAPDVIFLQCENQFFLNDHKLAIAGFKTFAAAHPAHPKVMFAQLRVGQSEHEQKNWTKVLAALEPLMKAKVKGPDFDQLEFLVAESYYYQENWAEAVKNCLLFAETKPSSANADTALLMAALASEQLGKPAEAIAAFQKLVTKYPKSTQLPAARVRLGILYYEAKKYPQAKAVLQNVSALKENKLRPKAEYFLAFAELNLGNTAAAAKLFGAMADDFPRHELAADARFHEGGALLQTEQFAEAQKALQKFIADHPEHPLTRQGQLGLAKALLKQKDAEAALKTFALAVRGNQLDEVGAEAQFLIGECYLGLNEFDLALTEFKKVEAFKLFDNWQANALYGQSVALEGKGEADLATEQLKNLVDKFPRSTAAREARKKLNKKPGDDN